MLEPWRITLLGTFCAQNDGLTVTRFRTQQTAGLLAYLAYWADRAHAREEVIGHIWPEDDPETGRTKLRIALSSLRRQLEPPGTPTETLLIAGRLSVRLNPQAIQTDVRGFEDALRIAEREAPEEQINTAAMRALQLYRGELLPGFYDEWIVPERERLAALYRRGVANLTARLEASGDLADAETWAQTWRQADPLDEEPYLALMRLAARDGKPALASRIFRDLERTLQQEINVAPSSAARALLLNLPPPASTLKVSAARNRSHADQLPKSDNDAAKPSQNTAKLNPTSNIENPQSNVPFVRLPVTVTRLFGRETAIAKIARAVIASLADATGPRLLFTLVGPGGAGKTRLAVEVARRVHGEIGAHVAFVALADVRDLAAIENAIADALNLPHSEASLRRRIADALAGRPGLLVLDNFEQIAATGAGVVESLRQNLPDTRLLITSRQPLRLAGERQIAVNPLPIPTDSDMAPDRLADFACVALFVDRAQSVRPDFQVGPRNAGAIAALCCRLDGLPLAIELAASWTGLLTPVQMLSRLETRLVPLANRKSSFSARHQTLTAALDWSLDLLPAGLRDFFAGLSIFRGGWTPEAARMVCLSSPASVTDNVTSCRANASEDGEAECLEWLARLRERSLLVAEPTPDGESLRYRLLETLREYGAERLDETAQTVLSRGHARYFLAYAEQVKKQLNSLKDMVGFRLLEQERYNCLAALDWFASEPNETEAELRMVYALHWFWWTRGYLAEARSRMDAVLSRADAPRYRKAYRDVLKAAAIVIRLQGDFALARVRAEQFLESAREENDPYLVAQALGNLGNTAKTQNDLPAARAYYTECMAISRTIGKNQMWAVAAGNLGNVAKFEGHAAQSAGNNAAAERAFAESEQCYRDSLAELRDIGDKQGLTVTLSNFAGLLGDLNRVVEALDCLAECIALCEEIDDRVGIAYALEEIGRIATAQGWLEEAIRLYTGAEKLRGEVGAVLPPHESADRDRDRARCLAELGQETYDSTASEAHKVPWKEALILARSLTGQAETIEIGSRNGKYGTLISRQ